MPWYRAVAFSAVLLGSCSSSSVEIVERPPDSRLMSRVRPDAAGEIVIAKFYTGGGGGDTTYRLLACPNAKKCDVLAGIDTHGGPAPALLIDRGVTILISQTDTIWNFSNITNYLQSGPTRRVAIRYR